ncbi:MSMEG_0570 family nitrogen starvation response protein [Synechococcus elongatus]|nr:MSMEG_0570 family nitrogen starvation response protein [Synechococcus elongatus]MBD2687584.1 MSMEG_0570 family nitrogen starvation response protein [Synechococcus elongatus FACHB-1061]AJD57720.1 hypothetical protein M744_07660 [Synechococcus elongatus UTEX 2973]MBD2586510.1 MSMEG_0570 family nitrogen starvation response protein [Synechococcus elongatus FACHB-242]MBD2706707.1 MSMEG_0570 family nitrogen starvation response protein [Synechococcus elongatus PCC 7942 = FACHB-805]WKW04754.1 MSMEG
MPEVYLKLNWPDGSESLLYSPSTVVLDYLKPGDRLTVAKLQQQGCTALAAASERVRARYGFACTRTDEETQKLQSQAANFAAEDPVMIELVQVAPSLEQI